MVVHRDKIGDCPSKCAIVSLDTFNKEDETDKQKQSIVIDPLSDRIGIVLVWQNLIVSTKESKKRKFIQKISLCKNKFHSKRQILLDNISGTITSGLCAVMG